MLKKKVSWKIASGCIAAAIALTATITLAVDATDIETAQTEGQVTASQSVTDETAAYTMANYEASQTQKVSFVSKKTDGVAMARYDSKQAPAATTTTKAASSTAKTTAKAAAATTAASTTKSANVVMPYIYDGYIPSAVTTTTAARVTNYTTTTARPATTTTKAQKTTTAAAKTVNVAATGSIAAPVIASEKTYDTDYTHPYNNQTKQIKLHWSAVSGAAQYIVFVKGGQYSNWTSVVSTVSTECTVSGLNRDTMYTFAVKSVDASGKTSALSSSVNIKTARMDYSAAGWQAMCRIVFHEVGGASGSFWDKPIVYVADCVANQYVCAKYTYQGSWPKYYSRYSSIESVIYTSGGFMSDANLAARGATYARVTQRVKLAVWGAVYGVTSYAGIANDYNVFYWCNSGTAKSDSRIAYGFKLPWPGYMYIWRQYWG